MQEFLEEYINILSPFDELETKEINVRLCVSSDESFSHLDDEYDLFPEKGNVYESLDAVYYIQHLEISTFEKGEQLTIPLDAYVQRKGSLTLEILKDLKKNGSIIKFPKKKYLKNQLMFEL